MDNESARTCVLLHVFESLATVQSAQRRGERFLTDRFVDFLKAPAFHADSWMKLDPRKG